MSGGRACMRGGPETWIIGFTEGKATPAADSSRCRTVKASETRKISLILGAKPKNHKDLIPPIINNYGLTNIIR
ncbi:hypothetical protein M9X92_009790 [Pyricularia oryzae]|nr:hypothetical protein M9X92_009790 [Pyricularia oryzae]